MENKGMDVAQAKRYFERGILTGFAIVDTGMMGINVVFMSKTANDPMTKARTNEVRTFKTFSAAISAVREVGFRAGYLEGKQ